MNEQPLDLTFAVLDVAPEPYAVSPVLTARVGIDTGGEDPVHAIALRCQVRIEPLRRPYSDAEADGLVDLFGARERWAITQRTFLWQHCTAMVPGFAGNTTVALPLDCIYDFEVTAAKYLHALRDGALPSISLQRDHLRQVRARILGPAGVLGLRRSIRHAGGGVASADRPALSKFRLGAAGP